MESIQLKRKRRKLWILYSYLCSPRPWAHSVDTVENQLLGLNTVWMLLAAMLVFFMQPGFALVEAGFTRVKNTANILMKNFVDFMFGSVCSTGSSVSD